MKTEETNKKKKLQKTNPLLHRGDFQKMAELMKNGCSDEGSAACCCSMMRRRMGGGKGTETKEAKEAHKTPKGGENG